MLDDRREIEEMLKVQGIVQDDHPQAERLANDRFRQGEAQQDVFRARKLPSTA